MLIASVGSPRRLPANTGYLLSLALLRHCAPFDAPSNYRHTHTAARYNNDYCRSSSSSLRTRVKPPTLPVGVGLGLRVCVLRLVWPCARVTATERGSAGVVSLSRLLRCVLAAAPAGQQRSALALAVEAKHTLPSPQNTRFLDADDTKSSEFHPLGPGARAPPGDLGDGLETEGALIRRIKGRPVCLLGKRARPTAGRPPAAGLERPKNCLDDSRRWSRCTDMQITLQLVRPVRRIRSVSCPSPAASLEPRASVISKKKDSRRRREASWPSPDQIPCPAPLRARPDCAKLGINNPGHRRWRPTVIS